MLNDGLCLHSLIKKVCYEWCPHYIPFQVCKTDRGSDNQSPGWSLELLAACVLYLENNPILSVSSPISVSLWFASKVFLLEAVQSTSQSRHPYLHLHYTFFYMYSRLSAASLTVTSSKLWAYNSTSAFTDKHDTRTPFLQKLYVTKPPLTMLLSMVHQQSISSFCS